MYGRSWLSCLRRRRRRRQIYREAQKQLAKRSGRPRSLSSTISLSPDPLWLEWRRTMSIEPLEEGPLLSAAPNTLYVVAGGIRVKIEKP